MNVRYTIQRNGTYYFNIKIPTVLQPQFQNKKHITKSLKTKNSDEANLKALQLYKEAKETFNKLSLNQQDRSVAAQNSAEPVFKNILLDLTGLGQVNIDTGSTEGDIKASKELIESVRATTAPPKPAVPNEAYMLSQAIQDYINRKTPDWNPKTLGQNENILSLLLEILGDKDVTEIKPADADLFRSVILKLPPNISRHRKAGLTIEQILKLNEKPRAITTSNRQFILVGSFFRWMVLRDDIVKSYFEKMTSKKGIKPADERDIYTEQELILAFSTLKDDVFQSHIVSPHNYWIPLVCLYTGMRVNEVAQLLVSDVDVTANTIEVRPGNGKSIKTMAGNRIIPIHSELIKLGFLNYVKTITNTRLFPKLSKGADGYGHNVSRWWAARGKKLGYKSIHSLRHTFIIKLKYAGINDYIVAQVVGHSMNSITFSRYGKGYELPVLKKAIESITFTLGSPC